MAETETAGMPGTNEDFAALLEEQLGGSDGFEGNVLKGTIVAVDDDAALVDVGLKSEAASP